MPYQLGGNTATPTTDRKQALLATMTDESGKVWVYVQASGAITGAGYACVIDETGQAVMATTTTTASAFGDRVGIPEAAFADDEYGWLQIYGPSSVLGAASCAANTAINSTATAGTLDDDATAGAEVIAGVVLTAAVGAGGAATAAAMLNYPTVGATL